MPTPAPDLNPGDIILDSHIESLYPPLNNLETGAAYYGVDGGSTDAYAVTLTPVPTSYTAGMLVHFKANTANTGAASLNVNGLGAKTIKKESGQDLATGDILAGQVVAVVNDGASFQLLSSERAAFAYLAGRSGGQTLRGDTASGGNLALQSTSHATRGHIYLGGSGLFDLNESNGQLGLGTAPSNNIRLALQYSPTTDAGHFGLRSRLDPELSTGAPVSSSMIALSGQVTVSGTDTLTGSCIGTSSQSFNNKTAGSITHVRGILGSAQNTNAGSSSNLLGVAGQWVVTGAGGVGIRAAALNALTPSATGTGAVAEAAGLYVSNQGAAICNVAYGVRIASQTGAATNWNLASDGASSNNYVEGLLSVGLAALPSARLHITEPTAGNEVLRLASVATNDDPTFTVRQFRTATTNATQATLGSLTLGAGKTYHLEARVVARRTGGTGGTSEDAASYVLHATYQSVAGAAVLVGAVSVGHAAESQAGWEATLDASGTAARVRVTGAANNNITWHATVMVQEVGS